MSIAYTHWARTLVTGDPRRKLLLVTLANYADPEGYAWPAMERLVQDTEMSVQVIRNVLRELEDARFIARHPDTDRAQQRYRVDVIKLRPRASDDEALLCALADTPKPVTAKKAKKATVARATDAQFEVFWRNYPIQTGESAAKKKFFQVINEEKVTYEALIAGLERYINKKDDRQWCLATTWLNQGRWSDGRFEVVQPARQPNKMAI